MYEKTNSSCFDDAKVRRVFDPNKFIQRIAIFLQQTDGNYDKKTRNNLLFCVFFLIFAPKSNQSIMNLSMKTLCLLLVISCTQVLPVSSQQITKERALEKANRFVTSAQTGQMKRSSASRQPAQLTLASNTEDYYIFNDEQNGGYVIIGGDERQ